MPEVPDQIAPGAEGFRVPARVNPASRILSEMFATATSQGDRMNPADTTRMADAFVEGFVSLMARTFLDQADRLRQDVYASRPFSSEKDIGKAEALESAAVALEELLPPDKRIDRRREY